MTLALLASLALAASPSLTPQQQAFRAELMRVTGTLRIPFESGEDQVSKGAEGLLAPLVGLLKRAPSPVEVSGHADARGDEGANKALSQRRAEAVKAWLVSRGVPAELLVARGYGAESPLAPNDTEAGRAQNRRIAFTLAAGGPMPDALVTSLRPAVQARPSQVKEWTPASVGLGLYRLDEVETLSRASAELTFRDSSVLRLQEKSMAIVYGDEAMSPKAQRGTVELLSGEAHLSLAQLRAGALTVATPAAAVAARSRALVVDVDPAQMSRVSVHQGSAQVAAAGARVQVRQGEGTRVEKGKKPEAPAPLPGAPRWDGATELARAARPEGVEVPLKVKPVPGAVHYRVEVASDAAFDQVEQVLESDGPEVRPGRLAAGTWYARAWAKDARGLIGPASPTLKLVVAPLSLPPTATAPWTPGLQVPEGFQVLVDGKPAAGPVPAGRHRVTVANAAGQPQEAWDVEVRSPAPSLSVESPPEGEKLVAHFSAPVADVGPLALKGVEGTTVGALTQVSPTDWEAPLGGPRPAKVQGAWYGTALPAAEGKAPPPRPKPVPTPALESPLLSRGPGHWGAPTGQVPAGPEGAVAVDLEAFQRQRASAVVSLDAPWGEGGGARLQAVAAVALGKRPKTSFEVGGQVRKRVAGDASASLSLAVDGALATSTGLGVLRGFAVGAFSAGLLDFSTSHGAGVALQAQPAPFYLGTFLASVRMTPQARLSLEGAVKVSGAGEPPVGLGLLLQQSLECGELDLAVRAGLTAAGRAEWGQLGVTAGWRFR